MNTNEYQPTEEELAEMRAMSLQMAETLGAATAGIQTLHKCWLKLNGIASKQAPNLSLIHI